MEEERYRLSILEEPQMLNLALRIIIRKLLINGGNITFPTPDAIDITLKRNGLPTDPKTLLNLTDLVLARRSESLDLHEVYNDFVRAHGRAVFNLNEPWPQCYGHIRFPT